MTGTEIGEESGKRVYPATVAAVLEPGMVVLNRGSSHGVTRGEEFLIYELSEREIEDPDSGEPLGRLEKVIAIGTVLHVQDRICTLELARKGVSFKRRVRKRSAFQAFPGLERELVSSETSELLSLPEVGDLAKPSGAGAT